MKAKPPELDGVSYFIVRYDSGITYALIPQVNTEKLMAKLSLFLLRTTDLGETNTTCDSGRYFFASGLKTKKHR